MSRWWRAILIQGASWGLAWVIRQDEGLYLALTAAALAMAVSLIVSEPLWRAPMQALFALALYSGRQVSNISPEMWLIPLLLMVPFFGAGVFGRIRAPLYLTDTRAREALLEAIPSDLTGRCLDVGAGFGRFIRLLARDRPGLQFDGVENAPLTWLLGALFCRPLKNAHLIYGDFWRMSLTPYTVVYAFLSPEAMPALWHKIKAEMNRGSVLIVHAFAIPHATPEASFRYGPAPSQVIYRYRI
jgi:SAM-dependent methyltransferase